MLDEQRKPTHILRIEIPLALDDPPMDYHPAKDAIQIALSISRAAFAGHVCDVAEVTMDDA
jgi:hypothetical protein